jgi:2-C-methyl-D-erythritol 4-phosphate cytidylyltransferase/2-C-methyl-D-erythritol 2,4-cyclodiphosphate synthase
MAPAGLPPIHLLLLAGGEGRRARRADASPPKQFHEAAGAMLLVWSVRELLACASVVTLTVAAPQSWHAVVGSALAEEGLSRPWLLAAGGPSRTASATAAAEALEAARRPATGDLVAIHDAARPFATRHLLQRVAAAAARTGGAVPGVPVGDTIVSLVAEDEGGEPGSLGAAARYLDRTSLRALQTPQVFRWSLFRDALRWATEKGRAFTDDGGLLAARGLDPVVVRGEPANWKVTTEDDLARAELMLRGR